MLTESCQYSSNEALRGGAIHIAYQSQANFIDCEISENEAADNGGAIRVIKQSKLILRMIQLSNNLAPLGGAAHIDSGSNLTIQHCIFMDNLATYGGSLFTATARSIQISNSQFIRSHGAIGSLYLWESKLDLTGNVTFLDNIGSLYILHSTVYFRGIVSFSNNTANKFRDGGKYYAPHEGGAITGFRAALLFENTSVSILQENRADNGGAVYMMDSQMVIYSTNFMVFNNSATGSGGGIYFYRSALSCRGNCTIRIIGNSANLKGGGAFIISSTIQLEFYRGDPQPLLQFKDNTAQMGGGLHLEANSDLYTWKSGHQANIIYDSVNSGFTIIFVSNSADYGGAISVADGTNIGACDSNIYASIQAVNVTECFLQIFDEANYILEYIPLSIEFEHNHALHAGSTIFGGLLDRCSVSPFAELFRNNMSRSLAGIVDGITYLKNVSNVNLNTVSSYPVRVCFCKNHQSDCNYQPPPKQVKKGEEFTVALVAVDQVNHTLSNVTIHIYPKFGESGLGDGQLIQQTGDQCSNLLFSITSPHSHEQLIIYAEGPCKDARLSQRQIDVLFLPCTCPIGFQQMDTEETNCICECDSELQQFVSNCNPQSETITKVGNSWISHINNTKNVGGYLIHLHCPFDYCLPSTPNHKISINLNKQDGADAQCAYNRASTLCGTCKSGFSLSLGSSRCVPCAHSHINSVVILLLGLLAGIILVAFLLILNLTVAVGTVNGVIFYANIVAANKSTFFPFSSPNFVTVFIAWLNLDLGFDVCFFNGMDAYWKLWMEIAFPTYLIILVVLIILISERHLKFAQLIGRKNPVATLATLIQLSYATLLRTIIAILSFAILDYPDSSEEIVWLYDGTVSYLKGKHVALFFMALLILLVGVIYTAILFFWQWLLHYQNKTIFKWVKNQKLYHFLEPYHAPYTFEHRYWTGLLLLTRAVLYTVAAINVSNDPAINLLAIGCVMTGILLLKQYLRGNKIYKYWPLEVIEMICYLNITLLSLSNLYLLESGRDSAVTAYISGSITFVLFVAILIYHIFTEIVWKSRLWKKFWSNRRQPIAEIELESMDVDTSSDEVALLAPTTTTIDAPPHGEQPLSALIEAGQLETSFNNQSKVED